MIQQTRYYFTDASLVERDSRSVGMASVIVCVMNRDGKLVQIDQRVVKCGRSDSMYIESAAIFLAVQHVLENPVTTVIIHTDQLHVYRRILEALNCILNMGDPQSWSMKQQLQSFELITIDTAYSIADYQKQTGNSIQLRWVKGHCSSAQQQMKYQHKFGFNTTMKESHLMNWGNDRADEYANGYANLYDVTNVAEFKPSPFFIRL